MLNADLALFYRLELDPETGRAGCDVDQASLTCQERKETAQLARRYANVSADANSLLTIIRSNYYN